MSAHLTDLLAAARAWTADDPDAVTRAELIGLADAAESGDADAGAELADAMAGMLEFGTAGLRGKLGGGNNRMNRAVVIRAAGGQRPLFFMVDGVPVASGAARREAGWTPPGPGFYRVTVLDAAGAAVSAPVRVRAAE